MNGNGRDKMEPRTFKEPEEELAEALEGLKRTDELTRENRKMLKDREETAPD